MDLLFSSVFHVSRTFVHFRACVSHAGERALQKKLLAQREELHSQINQRGNLKSD